jgi:nitroreductase
MDILEAIKTRKSVRDYREDPVSENSVNKIMEAARLAPSAHNAQNYKFVVVRDRKKVKELAKAANQSFIEKAPVVIVGVSLKPDVNMSSGVPAYSLDLGIALDHMTLEAVEQGLGTCWIGAFYQEEVKEVLGIPQNYKVAAMLTLGVPRDTSIGPKSRKDIAQLVCKEKFME